MSLDISLLTWRRIDWDSLDVSKYSNEILLSPKH